MEADDLGEIRFVRSAKGEVALCADLELRDGLETAVVVAHLLRWCQEVVVQLRALHPNADDVIAIATAELKQRGRSMVLLGCHVPDNMINSLYKEFSDAVEGQPGEAPNRHHGDGPGEDPGPAPH